MGHIGLLLCTSCPTGWLYLASSHDLSVWRGRMCNVARAMRRPSPPPPASFSCSFSELSLLRMVVTQISDDDNGGTTVLPPYQNIYATHRRAFTALHWPRTRSARERMAEVSYHLIVILILSKGKISLASSRMPTAPRT